MASNKELIDQIKAINPEAQTDGLKNTELAELLKFVKESVVTQSEGVTPLQVSNPTHTDDEDAAAKAQAQAEADAAAKAQAEADAAQQSNDEPTEQVYVVVEGQSITSKKGVLGPGAEVKAEYFAGGEEIIESLLERGLIK